MNRVRGGYVSIFVLNERAVYLNNRISNKTH